MDDRHDAYGHELLDHLEGRGGYEIVERDDGLIDTSVGPELYFAPYTEWSEVTKAAVAEARGRVLDVGCGAGRACLYLQERGHEVTGIDTSPLAVEVCRRRGVRDVRLLSITQVTRRVGEWDTVLMLGNNLGLLGGVRRGRWLLRRLHGATSPRARIVGESVDPYDTDDPAHLAYHARNRERGRLGGQVRIRVRYRAHVGRWFDYLLLPPEELRELVDGTGWVLSEVIARVGPNYAALLEKA